MCPRFYFSVRSKRSANRQRGVHSYIEIVEYVSLDRDIHVSRKSVSMRVVEVTSILSWKINVFSIFITAGHRRMKTKPISRVILPRGISQVVQIRRQFVSCARTRSIVFEAVFLKNENPDEKFVFHAFDLFLHGESSHRRFCPEIHRERDFFFFFKFQISEKKFYTPNALRIKRQIGCTDSLFQVA